LVKKQKKVVWSTVAIKSLKEHYEHIKKILFWQQKKFDQK